MASGMQGEAEVEAGGGWGSGWETEEDGDQRLEMVAQREQRAYRNGTWFSLMKCCSIKKASSREHSLSNHLGGACVQNSYKRSARLVKIQVYGQQACLFVSMPGTQAVSSRCFRERSQAKRTRNSTE